MVLLEIRDGLEICREREEERIDREDLTLREVLREVRQLRAELTTGVNMTLPRSVADEGCRHETEQ
jgi:hypothetical protein